MDSHCRLTNGLRNARVINEAEITYFFFLSSYRSFKKRGWGLSFNHQTTKFSSQDFALAKKTPAQSRKGGEGSVL